MKEITRQAMEAIMKRAPVWAASMAGRTKVFTDESVETALVTGGNGRFKIVVNPTIAEGPDLEFVIMHEIAHVFREDIVSMQYHPGMAQDINIAADCIINDTLLQMGVPKPVMDHQLCWGKDIYGMYCTGKSINQLLNVKQQNEAPIPTAPGSVNSKGESTEEGEEGNVEGEEPSGGVGATDDPCKIVGIGKDPIIHEEMKPMARSIAAYARSQFFETGFKSNNMVTRLDWRRNRSAFAGRNDIVIPRSKTSVGGKEYGGPLINLVLDVSGSMRPSWVATAAVIAEEIEEAGLDFDLWLTPVRRKAKDKHAMLKALKNGKGAINNNDDLLEDMSFPDEQHWGGHVEYTQIPGGPSNVDKDPRSNPECCDELVALRCFETADPVVWIYIGDYFSTVGLKMHFQPNFLHVCMTQPGDRYGAEKVLNDNALPRWFYKP
jgi:hypothetical protein